MTADSPSARKAIEIHLASRPYGAPSTANFELVEVVTPEPGPGEVVVRNRYLSVEPYMRARMDPGESYIPRFEIGEPLEGGAVGTVLESRSPELEPGDVVLHQHGWREVAIGRAEAFEKLDAADIPPSSYLGGLGGPGLAAYVGVVDIGRVQVGDTVFVSGAAGAVGSMAGQIARLKGASRVIGSAGSAEKLKYLTEELGFDAALNYKEGPIVDQLAEAAPEGIDVFFDNVGREHLEAAIAVMNDHGRMALCGAIADHNDQRPGPRNLFQLVLKRISSRGFIIVDHLDRMPAFRREAEQWLRDGEIVMRESLVDGIEHTPDALVGLYRGDSIGKRLVRLPGGDV